MQHGHGRREAGETPHGVGEQRGGGLAADAGVKDQDQAGQHDRKNGEQPGHRRSDL
jgi:hypothetical protein